MRNVCPTKPKLKNDPISVIIPAASPPPKTEKRGKYYGAISLFPINSSTTLIQHQIEIVQAVLPQAEIIVVGGFEINNLIEMLPKHIRVVENELYENRSVVSSIRLGLINASYNSALIIYGNLFFTDVISSIPPRQSTVLLEKDNDNSVGVTIINQNVTYFSYGLPKKWAQIAYLTGNEFDIFRRLCLQKENGRLYTHEILNKVVEKGTIQGLFIPENNVKEVGK